jgi:acyl transferase domain-containing protein
MMNQTTLQQTKTGFEIAVIGLSGRFPGAETVEQLWRNLCEGVESISVFTDSELEASCVPPVAFNNPRYVRARGVLGDVAMFDAPFFGFTRREAELMDPQHRLFLESAVEALESAGYDSQRGGERTGVYAGVGTNTYFLRHIFSRPELINLVGEFQALLGNDKDHLATLASYKLNLGGPSLTVQTACSTSLVAVHLACRSLLGGECDMALAGGVSISVPQKAGYVYEQGGIYSPDGHCRAFDAGARGTVCGNGVGVVVLKRLEDALADGDFVHAIIKGSAINNDGANRVGYTAPGVKGQAEVISAALAAAEVEPETVTYVEAHGTGTSLGDPIEIAALTRAFRSRTSKRGFCALGSVKTNIGHLDTAAGVTGLIKTVLALKHKQLPPSLHFTQPNTAIEFDTSPFYVNTVLREWKTDGCPRRAGVSSFGIGGTNAHVIVEEPPGREVAADDEGPQLILLSARTPGALASAAANLAAYLNEHTDENLADVAYTLQVGRGTYSHRWMHVYRDAATAASELSRVAAPRDAGVRSQGDVELSVAFMFPGQGSQYPNMSLELYGHASSFRREVDACLEILSALGLSLRDALYPPLGRSEEASELLRQTFMAQPALFVIEYALARLWMEWGVHPKAMIGHSVGEYVAACLAGVFSLEDALKIVTARGRLMQQLPPGTMLAVPLGEEDVSRWLEGVEGVSLAGINSPSMCVVSGDGEAVAALRQRLAAEQVECQTLHTSHAFHSEVMTPILEEFAAQVEGVTLRPPRLPFVSNLTGTWITPAESTDPSYWARHLRHTVRFADGLTRLLDEPDCLLLEVGPGQTLSTLARQVTNGSKRSPALSSLPGHRSTDGDRYCLMTTLGRLWQAGLNIDWQAVHQDAKRRRLPLPTYPFQRERYWIEPGERHVGQESAREQGEAETALVAQADDAPGNEVERVIVNIWQDLFGIERVGIHDNFFDLGGNSLLAIQIITQIRKAFEIELPMSSFFTETPTVAGHARVVMEHRFTDSEVEELHDLISEIEALPPDELQAIISSEPHGNGLGGTNE